MSETSESSAVQSNGRDPFPVAARKLLRETLLDAAHSELEVREWDEITMADIAATAGVSRQTLYKEFGSRDEFAQAFVMREGERFLADVEGAILENRKDPRKALRSAFQVFLEAADRHPMVRSALSGHGVDTIMPQLTTQGGPVIVFVTTRLTEIIGTGWPKADRDDVDLLAEILVRLGISYLSDRPKSPAETAAAITRILTPFLQRGLVDSDGAPVLDRTPRAAGNRRRA